MQNSLINRNLSLQNDLINRKKFLDKTIKEMEKIIQNSPEGCLRISKRKKRDYYYHRLKPDDLCGHYIRKKDSSLASALAQKAYAQDILSLARKEIKQVDSLLKYLDQLKIEQLYDLMDSSRKALINPITMPDDEFVRSWLQIPYDKKSFAENTPEYYSSNGLRVRSKSEILIADALDRFHIPFRYECPLSLKGLGTVHPDFTVLNVRERKEYFWEHFGMMDSSSYVEKACKRIEAYEMNGYFPGCQLLLTFETSNIPLNTKLINKVILTFLK